MTNNDIIRRLRFAFNKTDKHMQETLALAGFDATTSMIKNWLRKDDDPHQEKMVDPELAAFLNGLIIEKRGSRPGPLPPLEDPLTNNMILRKLKIALSMQSEDMLAVLKLMDMNLSKHELSAFFRHPHQNQFRHCKDQVLRKFIYGLQKKLRPDIDKSKG